MAAIAFAHNVDTPVTWDYLDECFTGFETRVETKIDARFWVDELASA
jgi:hypothetical protein